MISMWAIINKTTNKVHDKFYSKAAAEALLSKMSSDYKVQQYPSDREIFENGKIVMKDTFKDACWSGKHGTTMQITIVEYEGKLFYFRIEDGFVSKVIEIGIKGV